MPGLEALHPWIAVAAVLIVFVGMQLRRGAPTDLLFLGALVLVTVTGVIGVETALAGFSNPAVITIAGLFVAAAGLRAAGVLDWVGHRLLGQVHTERGALRRLAWSMVSASAFLLNTAIVAMMMPVVIDWCRRRRVSPARLLLPLSYLAILGGVCTLIGTSTSLVINGMLKTEHRFRQQQLERSQLSAEPTTSESAQIGILTAITARGDAALPVVEAANHVLARRLAWSRRAAVVEAVRPMGFFEIGYVGLPCAIAGTLFFVLIGWRLLPKHTDPIEKLEEQRREYLVEMLVQPECRLIGLTVEQAGLRHLPGLFLIEIDRNGDLITPVTPSDVIHAGDRLVFTGVVSTIVDLEKIPGLVPAADLAYEIHPTERSQRHLTEVVLSRTSPLVGATVRSANFRQRYNAAVVAVHRNGVRLTNKIGDIRLVAGDTLLLQTRTEFVSAYRNSRDFYLVSSVEGSEPVRHHKAWVAAGLSLLLVVWLSLASWLGQFPAAAGLGSTAIAAIAVAGLMVATGCLRVSDARAALDLQVLITIAAALGVGHALTESGAALAVADWLVSSVGRNPYVLLIVMYLLTVLLTEMISNAAVAAMLLPVAVAVAVAGGCSPRPFVMAIALAASLSFVTPIGYQTNLMVMGPGGYRPADYLRAGLPLAAVVMATALVLIPIVWPL